MIMTQRWLVWIAGGAALGVGALFMSAEQGQAQPGQFAADRDPRPAPGATPAEIAVEFDKTRAMGYLKKICEIGPRISGSAGMKTQQDLLKKHFEDLGAKVELQKFTAAQRSQKDPVEMANLIARWNPDRARRIILCAHYDTRPIADQERDRRHWKEPFLAANDGASGAALMMELAHHMAKLKTEVGIDFVLFDGEEYIFDPTPQEQGGDIYFFGSKHFARDYDQGRKKDPKRPVYTAAVLVDMIAGKGATFFYEQHSWAKAGPLVAQLWKIADEVKAKAFVPELRHAVLDDHIQLQRVGIPAVDIIDFDYPHWHKLTDTPAACSSDTMEQVARVLVVWMQRSK